MQLHHIILQGVPVFDRLGRWCAIVLVIRIQAMAAAAIAYETIEIATADAPVR